MRIRPATVVVALLLLSVTACGGRAARDQNRAMLEAAGEKWFCQVAEDLENWDCVQSDRLAAAPQPERMPVPQAPEEDAGFDAGPGLSGGLAYDPFESAVLSTAGPSPASDPSPTVAAAEPAPPEGGADETEPSAGPEDTGEVPADTPTDAPAEVNGSDSTASEEQPIVVPDSAETAFVALPRFDPVATPDEAYLIQLVAMRSLTTLEQVVRDRELLEVLIARVAANNNVYYVLLAGPYSDEVAAQEVATNPPPQLEDFQLWVRSGRSLKDSMREADALVSAEEAVAAGANQPPVSAPAADDPDLRPE